MTWVKNNHGIGHWIGGEFPEPSDAALEPYVVHLRTPSTCGDKRGTPTGAQRHRRKGETPCQACATGHAQYAKAKRERYRDNPCIDCGTLILRKSTRCNTCSTIHQNKEASA